MGFLLIGLEWQIFITESEANKIKRTQEFESLCEKSDYYLNHNDLHSALEYINKALQLQPDSDKALWQKGIILEASGHPEEALDILYRAKELSHYPALFSYTIAKIFSSKHAKENAVKNLAEAIKQDKTFVNMAKNEQVFGWLFNDDDFKRLLIT
jgi:tetratricopeptide (TPR) repeat protein